MNELNQWNLHVQDKLVYYKKYRECMVDGVGGERGKHTQRPILVLV